MERIRILVGSKLLREFEQEAKRRKMSRSALICEAVWAHLRTVDKISKGDKRDLVENRRG